jgi:hypothetical protein
MEREPQMIAAMAEHSTVFTIGWDGVGVAG